MGYIAYQALNGGKPVTSKSKVRKRLRLAGRGSKGGCTPAAGSGSASHVTAASATAHSSSDSIGTKSAGRSLGGLPFGRKPTSDPYEVYCHNGHYNDYFPTKVKASHELTCHTCNQKFVVK